jgi:carbamoyl-phosphate synthase large subunit
MSAQPRSRGKVMILGAAAAQVPIIQRVHEYGFRSVVVSVPGNYPGFAVADEYHEIDIRDEAQVLAIAKTHSLCGILTDQTDVGVPTVARVADELGLPGIGHDCALRFVNKFLMRQAAERIGIPVPRYVEISRPDNALREAAALRYPLMVKPVDSQGSRGVSLVSSSEQLIGRIREALPFSREWRVIVEEYFAGTEVVVAGVVSDYDFRNLAAGERSYFDIPQFFVPKSTVFPWSLPRALAAKVLGYNERLIRGLGPRFGITHSEFLVNTRSGEVVLVETAIRGGGMFISSDLVPLCCGVDVEGILVEHATGIVDRVNLPSEMPMASAAGYFCFRLAEGVVTEVAEVEKLRTIPGVRRAMLDNVKVGSRVPPLTDKTARLGPIIIGAEDRQACEAVLARVRRALRIEVTTPHGIESVQW